MLVPIDYVWRNAWGVPPEPWEADSLSHERGGTQPALCCRCGLNGTPFVAGETTPFTNNTICVVWNWYNVANFHFKGSTKTHASLKIAEEMAAIGVLLGSH
jgi:hypothetical protein